MRRLRCSVDFRSFCALAPLELASGVLSAVLFAVLAWVVMSGATATFDEGVYAWMRRGSSPALDGLAWVVSILGSEAIGVVHLVLLAVLLKRRRWELALGLFVATAGAGFLNGQIKDVFQRDRPAEVYGLLPATGGQLFSFPSGHAMVSAAFLFFLAYVTWPVVSGGRRRALAIGLVVVLIVVGLARTYLGAHYLTDVVAGYLIGFVWADIVILAGYLLGCRWPEAATRVRTKDLTEAQPAAGSDTAVGSPEVAGSRVESG